MAEGNLDATTQEIINLHSKICGSCREDVRSFLAFRKESARDMEISYAPAVQASTREGFSELPWWRSFGWRPTYAVAVAVLATLALVTVALILKRRSETLEAKKNEPTQINAQASPTLGTSSPPNLPSPSAPELSRLPNVTSSPTAADNSAVVTILKDGPGEVTIDKTGRVSGLDEISSISRQGIAQASLTERIETPEILKSLGGQDSSLRGSNNDSQSFGLLYPARKVIVEARPVFKWESLSGASGYRVYVLDSKGNEVAKTEDLSAAQTQWTPKTSLKRGEVFSWVVTAVVNGKEIVAPAASAPEMKFAVLSIKDMQELNQLKKTGSHLALGVVYARAGLLSEAEREFQKLVQMNPQSQLPQKLLQSVRSLHQPK